MRTPILSRSNLSRSVIAIASLAIGSAALTAAPAVAAPAEVTRAEVLAVTAAVRAGSPDAPDAVEALTRRACSVDPSRQIVSGKAATATAAGQGADGLVVHATIIDRESATGTRCSFGAIASAADSSALGGSARLELPGQVPVLATLSGEVAVTGPLVISMSSVGSADATFQATGQSVQTIKTVTSKKVSTPKSSKTKKAAKKKYVKRIKAAKKSYAKALKKAGGSKTKKQTAKRSYVRKRAAAKASYKKAVARYKIVTKTSVRTTSTPFALTAQ